MSQTVGAPDGGTDRRPTRSARLVGLAVCLCLFVAGCSDGGPAAGVVEPSPSSMPTQPPSFPDATTGPEASGLVGMSLCDHVGSVEETTAALRAVELRLPNRVALDIELGRVQAAFSELRQADLGAFEEQLEEPLTRLGYRLIELELAVEDFRTDPRPRRAAPHVEKDAEAFADALAGFAILARC